MACLNSADLTRMLRCIKPFSYLQPVDELFRRLFQFFCCLQRNARRAAQALRRIFLRPERLEREEAEQDEENAKLKDDNRQCRADDCEDSHIDAVQQSLTKENRPKKRAENGRFVKKNLQPGDPVFLVGTHFENVGAMTVDDKCCQHPAAGDQKQILRAGRPVHRHDLQRT